MPSVSRPYIGGQAVLEGVMMRAPTSFAVVVRRRDGSLHVRERAMTAQPGGILRWPLVRGITALAESLRLGSEALHFSVENMEADMAADSVVEPPPGTSVLGALGLALVAAATRDDAAPVDPAPQGSRKGRGGTWVMAAFAIAFFVALPQLGSALVNRVLHLGLEVQSAPFQAITGTMKLAIIIGYLFAIRRIPEIKRVFQYHGAEHKTISTYEAGAPLTLEAARARTTLHPRCGTTFLVMVALVSVIFFAVLGAALPRIHTGSMLLDNVAFFLLKLPILPVLVGVTFELQRVLARFCSTGPLRALLWPGFLVQRITTAEPDDAQLEVALASLHGTLYRQEKGQAHAAAGDATFASYAAFLEAPYLHAPAPSPAGG